MGVTVLVALVSFGVGEKSGRSDTSRRSHARRFDSGCQIQKIYGMARRLAGAEDMFASFRRGGVGEAPTEFNLGGPALTGRREQTEGRIRIGQAKKIAVERMASTVAVSSPPDGLRYADNGRYVNRGILRQIRSDFSI
jgi:hypothetical protein